MQTIIANFSHIDALVFNQDKTKYSHSHMLACLRKEGDSIQSSEGYTVVKDLQGKPWAYKKSDKDRINPFSVTTSHSYPYVYSGHSRNKDLIGCDVEKIRDFEDFFLTSFLHPHERSHIDTLDVFLRNEEATIAWTIKESFLKALGSGLRVHPKRVDVSSILLNKKKNIHTVTCDGKSRICTIVSLEKVGEFIFCFLSMPRQVQSKCLE